MKTIEEVELLVDYIVESKKDCIIRIIPKMIKYFLFFGNHGVYSEMSSELQLGQNNIPVEEASNGRSKIYLQFLHLYDFTIIISLKKCKFIC